jgi:hypothetical protein
MNRKNRWLSCARLFLIGLALGIGFPSTSARAEDHSPLFNALSLSFSMAQRQSQAQADAWVKQNTHSIANLSADEQEALVTQGRGASRDCMDVHVACPTDGDVYGSIECAFHGCRRCLNGGSYGFCTSW